MLLAIPFFPERASSIAAELDHLTLFLFLFSSFLSLAIAGTILYFAIRYRRRPDRLKGLPLRGSTAVEITWIVIPTIIGMVMFVWGARVYFTLYSPPLDAMEIYVVAKQWMWKFQQPDGQKEINELHVPAGRDIRLTMTTEDVIHSFFVPAFRVKMDVVPGRYRTLWFRAIKPGVYHLFCTEYCGTNHSGMGGWVIVMEPAAYQEWKNIGRVTGSVAANGEKLFQQFACDTCHRSDMQGRGPVLDGLYGQLVPLDSGQSVVADESYIRESIVAPAAKVVAGFAPIMPSFQGLMSEEQVLELVAYVKSLGTQPVPPEQPAGAVMPRSRHISPSLPETPDSLRSNPVSPTPPHQVPIQAPGVIPGDRRP